jgi:hypothetical protein
MEIKKFKMFIRKIEEFEESFPQFELDYLETEIEDFAHPDPLDDFGRRYILVDEDVEIEKEYVFVDETNKDEEAWVYTNKDGYINGYAFNRD